MKRLMILLSIVFVVLPSWALSGGFNTNVTSDARPQFTTTTVTAVDAAVLTAPAFLQCIMISQADAAPTAGSITLYDNTAESGTIVFTHTFTTAVFMPFQICPQRQLAIGLYIGMNGPADIDVIVSYGR